MSSQQIVNYETFDISNILYKNPERIENNIFTADIQYNKGRLLFQTPYMKLFSDPIINENTGNYQLALQFSIEDKDFYDFIESVDAFNTDYIYQNSEKWFENKFSKTIISAFYESCINNYTDEITNIDIPYILADVPVYNNVPDINIYDSNKQLLEMSSLKKNTQVSTILELRGLKFLKKKLIADWNIVQIKVDNNKINLTNFLLNNNKSYNTDVIDEEIVDELADEMNKVESHDSSENDCNSQKSSEDLKFNGSHSHSLTSENLSIKLESEDNQISDSGLELNSKKITDDETFNNIKQKRLELEKAIQDVNEANQLVEHLRLTAIKTAEEMKSLTESFSIFENN